VNNDTPKYKAIETVHSGFRFRSRLEARWAVFFESLGIDYRYEFDGIDLEDGTWYLPDFYLPKLKTWIEIKPDVPTPKEREKAIQLSIATGQEAIIFSGDIWTDVKGFSFAPLIAGIPSDREYISNFYPDTPIHWISTTECIGVETPQALFGVDLQRRICWSYATWTQCTVCNSFCIFSLGTSDLCTCHYEVRSLEDNTPRLIAAYKAARQARF